LSACVTIAANFPHCFSGPPGACGRIAALLVEMEENKKDCGLVLPRRCLNDAEFQNSNHCTA